MTDQRKSSQEERSLGRTKTRQNDADGNETRGGTPDVVAVASEGPDRPFTEETSPIPSDSKALCKSNQQTSPKKTFLWKIDDFIRNILVGVVTALLAFGAASWYEQMRLDRLYNEVTFRYFDSISRTVVEKNRISDNIRKKNVYFAILHSIAKDVEHIRQNQIFLPEQEKINELATLQTLIVQAIELRNYPNLYENNISLVMEKFCARFRQEMIDGIDSLVQKKPNERTETEQVMVNAKLICEANFPCSHM